MAAGEDEASGALWGLPMWAWWLIAAGTAVAGISVVVGALNAGDEPGSGGDSEDAFYEAVFASDGFDVGDQSNVSDAELLAAGREFCSILSDGTSFDAAAESIARAGLADARGTVNSDGNAQIVLSYSVGIAAVEELCPEHTATLG
jgi:hypothetical protein